MATIEELAALVESNARSIQALSQEWRAAAEVNRVDMDTVNQRLDRTEQIQENNSVQLAELTTAVSENNQRIQVLIEESRDSRNWLRAAQENIQNILGEIRRLWERINAA